MTSIASPDFGQMLRPQYRGVGGLRQQFQQPQMMPQQMIGAVSPPGFQGVSTDHAPMEVDPRKAFHQQQQQQHLAQLQMQQAMPRSDMLGQLRSLGAQIPLPQQAAGPRQGPAWRLQQANRLRAAQGESLMQPAPQSIPYGGGPGFAKPISPPPSATDQAGGGAGGPPTSWKMSIEPMAAGGMIPGYQEGSFIQDPSQHPRHQRYDPAGKPYPQDVIQTAIANILSHAVENYQATPPGEPRLDPRTGEPYPRGDLHIALGRLFRSLPNNLRDFWEDLNRNQQVSVLMEAIPADTLSSLENRGPVSEEHIAEVITKSLPEMAKGGKKGRSFEEVLAGNTARVPGFDPLVHGSPSYQGRTDWGDEEMSRILNMFGTTLQAEMMSREPVTEGLYSLGIGGHPLDPHGGQRPSAQQDFPTVRPEQDQWEMGTRAGEAALPTGPQGGARSATDPVTGEVTRDRSRQAPAATADGSVLHSDIRDVNIKTYQDLLAAGEIDRATFDEAMRALGSMPPESPFTTSPPKESDLLALAERHASPDNNIGQLIEMRKAGMRGEENGLTEAQFRQGVNSILYGPSMRAASEARYEAVMEPRREALRETSPVDPPVPTYDPTFDEGAAEYSADPISLQPDVQPAESPVGKRQWIPGTVTGREGYWLDPIDPRTGEPYPQFEMPTMFSEREIARMIESGELGNLTSESRSKRRRLHQIAAKDAEFEPMEVAPLSTEGYQDELGLTTDDPYLSSIGNYELPPELPEGFRLPYEEEEEVSGPSLEGLPAPWKIDERTGKPYRKEGVSVEGLGDKYDELSLPQEYLDNMREAGVPTDRAGEYLEHMAWLTRTPYERAAVDPLKYLRTSNPAIRYPDTYSREQADKLFGSYRGDIDEKYGPTEQRDANSVFALASSLFGAPGTGNRFHREHTGGMFPTDPPDDHYLAGLYDPDRGLKDLEWKDFVRFGLGRSGGGIVGLAGGGYVPMYAAYGGEIPGYFLGGLWKGVKKVGKGLGSLALKAAPIVAGAWNPLLGAGVGALISGIKNKSLKDAIIGGAVGYLGGKALGSGLEKVGWMDKFGKFGGTEGGQKFLKAFGAESPGKVAGLKALIGKGAGETAFNIGKNSASYLDLAKGFGGEAMDVLSKPDLVKTAALPVAAQLAENEARAEAAEAGLDYNSQLNPWGLQHQQYGGGQFAMGADPYARQTGAGAQQFMRSGGGLIGYSHGGTHATQWLRNQYLMANPGMNTGVTDADIFAWAQANGVPNTEGGYQQEQGRDSRYADRNRFKNQFGGGLPGEEGGWDEGDPEWWTNTEGDWQGRGYRPEYMQGYPSNTGVANQGAQWTPTVPETPGAVAPGELVEVPNTPHEDYRAGLQAQTAFATGEGDISGIDPFNMPTDPSEFEDPVTQQWLQSLTPQSAQEGGPIDASNRLIAADQSMTEDIPEELRELGRMAILGGIPEPEKSNILRVIEEQYPILYQELVNELRTEESQSAGREGIVTEGFIPPFADGGAQSSGAVDDRLAVTKDDFIKEDFEERLAQGKNLQVAAAVAPYEYIVKRDDVFSTPLEVVEAAQQIDPETPAGPGVWDQLVANLGEPEDQYA